MKIKGDHIYKVLISVALINARKAVAITVALLLLYFKYLLQ